MSSYEQEYPYEEDFSEADLPADPKAGITFHIQMTGFTMENMEAEIIPKGASPMKTYIRTVTRPDCENLPEWCAGYTFSGISLTLEELEVVEEIAENGDRLRWHTLSSVAELPR